MRKRMLSLLLSLVVTVSMCIPCTAFAESENVTNIAITVCEPVPGQPYHEAKKIEGIDYSMTLKESDQLTSVGHFDYMHKYENGSAAMNEGQLFDYDSTYTIEACILWPSMDKPFTGSYTATVNGRAAEVKVQNDDHCMFITCELKTGSRTPIEDIYLDGYKPVKVGTTPARLSKSAKDTEGNYTASGYYTDFYMAQSNEIYNFKAGTDYYMHIYVEAPYTHTFKNIRPENIHIEGYDMPDEGVEFWSGDGSLGGSSSYLMINIPAGKAEENIYYFTVPEPKEGALPGQATMEANDDIICTGTTWYKSPDDWFNSPDTVKMKDGERFKAGYNYFVQPQYSWKDEELAPGSYTINVNGNTYNGEYYDFGHIYKNIDLKITVAEPKLGGTPAQTFSANIPISNQVCRWYFLPNAPSTDGFQPMEPTDKFTLGCCYAFVPRFNYDSDIYDINRIYVNGVDISEKDFMMFGPIEKKSQTIKNVSTTYSKAYGTVFTLKPTSSTSRTYKSSNTKVATVGKSSGKVTIKGIGSAKITITAAESSTYKEATKTITVKGVPKKPSISKVTPKKKAMTVKMKSKVSTTKGTTYQIAYRVKGTSKWKYKTTKNQSLTIKKLKKGKRYQVKVRAYKTVGKTKYYSSWSSIKTSSKIK